MPFSVVMQQVMGCLSGDGMVEYLKTSELLI